MKDNYEELERGDLVVLAVASGVKGNLPSPEMIAEIRVKDAELVKANEGTDDTTPSETPPVDATPPPPPEMKNERPPADSDAHRPVAETNNPDPEPAEILPILSDKEFDGITKHIENRFGKPGRSYGMVVNKMKRAVRELDKRNKENAEQQSKD